MVGVRIFCGCPEGWCADEPDRSSVTAGDTREESLDMDRLSTLADERGLLVQRRVIMPTEYDARLVEMTVITVRGALLGVYVDEGSYLVVHVRWDNGRSIFRPVPATCGRIAPEGSSIDPLEWLQGAQWVPSYPDGESRVPLKAPNWVIEITEGESRSEHGED